MEGGKARKAILSLTSYPSCQPLLHRDWRARKGLDSSKRLGEAKFPVPQPTPSTKPLCPQRNPVPPQPQHIHTVFQTRAGAPEVPQPPPARPRKFKCVQLWGSDKRLGPCSRQEGSHAARVAPKWHLRIWHKRTFPRTAALLLPLHPTPVRPGHLPTPGNGKARPSPRRQRPTGEPEWRAEDTLRPGKRPRRLTCTC